MPKARAVLQRSVDWWVLVETTTSTRYLPISDIAHKCFCLQSPCFSWLVLPFFERNLWFDVSLALFALSNAFFVCISKSLLLIISPGTSSYIPQKQLGTQFVASASALKLTVIISLLADIHFDQSQFFSVCVGYCNLFARLYSTPLQKPWFGKGISTHGMTEGGCSILGGRD